VNTKKIVLITVGSLFGIILLGFLTILSIRLINQSINGAKVNGNKVTTAQFEVTLPQGATLTNENKTSNNIYVTVPTGYGELRVSIVGSSYNVIQLKETGKVTSEDITVDGTNATLKTISYSNTIKGTSQKLLIRYKMSVDKIAQPSDKNYTTFEATAMSKRNLTSSEQKDVEEMAKTILQSLVIK